MAVRERKTNRQTDVGCTLTSYSLICMYVCTSKSKKYVCVRGWYMCKNIDLRFTYIHTYSNVLYVYPYVGWFNK